MKTKVRKILPFLTLISTLLKAANIKMYKIIVTFNYEKVIQSPTEKVLVHQELTLNLENELSKYLNYLIVYLEDKVFKLGKKITLLYLSKREHQ